MTADLSALIARLEAAEVGSRELDAAVCDALNWRRTDGVWTFPAPVSQSLDAALALAERVFPGCGWDVASKTPHIQACLDPELGEPCAKHPHWAMITMGRAGTRQYHDGATPPLSLCIAILRAKQGEGE